MSGRPARAAIPSMVVPRWFPVWNLALVRELEKFTNTLISFVVRTAGVEPARLAAQDFKSRASTGFATSASGSPVAVAETEIKMEPSMR